MSTYRGVTKCLRCGAPNDAHTSAESTDRPPEAGDISVCAYCGNIGTYDVEGQLQPTDVNTLIASIDPQNVQRLLYVSTKTYIEWMERRTVN